MIGPYHWRHALQFRINLLFGLVIAVIVLVLALTLTLFARDVLIERDRSRISQAADLMVAELNQELESAVSLTRAISSTASVQSSDQQDLHVLLWQLLSDSPRVELIAGGGLWPEPYVLDKTRERASLFWGRVAQGELKYFDNYNQPDEPAYQRTEWYQPARFYQGDHCYWSRSYADPYTQTPMVTCSVAIIRQQNFWGVATVDVRLDGVQRLLNKHVEPLNGDVMLMDRNQRLIVPPKLLSASLDPATQQQWWDDILDKIGQFRQQKMLAGDQRYAEQLEGMVDQLDPVEAQRISTYLVNADSHHNREAELYLVNDPVNDESVQASVVLMKNTDWVLVVLVPDKVVLADAQSLFWQLLLVLVTAVVVGVAVIGYWLQRELVMPIKQITGQVCQGEAHKVQLDEVPGAELQALLQAFNSQYDQLQLSRQDAEESHQRLQRMMDSAIDAILTLSANGEIIEVTPSAERLLKAEFSSLHGRQLGEMFSEQSRLNYELKLKSLLSGEVDHITAEELHLQPSGIGGEVVVELSMTIWVHKQVQYVTLFLRDISERKAAEARIQYMASRDSLTGLLNRYQFNEQLKFALEHNQRHKTHLAVLLIDLDHFKAINDSYGHQAGDNLLVEVAHRLKTARRATDLVARLGGDEFAVILPELKNIDSVPAIAQAIVEVLQQPFLIEQQVCRIGASIGITFFPDNADNCQELLRQADMAMYEAKSEGRSTWRCYAHELNDDQQQLFQRRIDLEKALADGQLFLIYQPVISIGETRSNMIEFEALLRWRHPILGVLLPNQFLPQTERSELMIKLGHWVLETICKQLQHWQQDDLFVHVVSVNVAPLQLEHGNLHQQLSEWLVEYQLSTDRVAFEVAESTLLDTNCMQELDQLTAMEVPLVLDSFGAGYASLSLLQRFPISQIKLSPTLVHDLEWNQTKRTLCKAIVVMAHNLNIRVIAKGVETAGQAELLTRMGCDALQGYYLYRPVRTMSEIRCLEAAMVEAEIDESEPTS